MFVLWEVLDILDPCFSFHISTCPIWSYKKSNFALQIVVENLSMKQTEVEVEVRGPPVAKAFDQEGNPTKVGYPIGWCMSKLFTKAVFCTIAAKGRFLLE
jgi:hypothetical protein